MRQPYSDKATQTEGSDKADVRSGGELTKAEGQRTNPDIQVDPEYEGQLEDGARMDWVYLCSA